MLEILLLWGLGKTIAAKAQAKGHSASAYVVLLIALWIVGEILGFVFGAIATAALDPQAGEPNLLIFIGTGYGGAALGAVIAFSIVGALSDRNQQQWADDDDYGRGTPPHDLRDYDEKWSKDDRRNAWDREEKQPGKDARDKDERFER